MASPFLCAFVSVVVIAAGVPAQGQKPAPASSPSKPAVAPKDDAFTAKDPVIVALDKFRKAKANTKAASWKSSLPAPPLQAFDRTRAWRWHLQTSKGPLVIQLLPDNAPLHVTSTIYLSRCGFYDGLTFPRILEGFMAQGGSPTNTTAGNAGYALDGEFLTGRKHDSPGILSAANSGAPNTDGSQFFLTFVPTPHLDGKHTVYGVVVEGLDTLKAIEACGAKRDPEPHEKEPPPEARVKETVTIERTWITVAPKPEETPKSKDAAPPGKTGR